MRHYTIEARGDRSVFVTTESAQAVYEVLRERADGVLDVVPAMHGVGVHYDPRILAFNDVRELLESQLGTEIVTREEILSNRVITIPVTYDGPDLSYVAENAGLNIDDVIALHTNSTYRVKMIGFAPGFAYLTGLDQRLITPRRNTPRTKVPAGSVGIGGDFTGVYPIDSPGGWQLIGHTELVLFDPARDEPTLLQPNDVVRFVAT